MTEHVSAPHIRMRIFPNFNKQPPAIYFGLGIVLFWLVVAIFANFISPYDPIWQDYSAVLEGPSATHFFGTDNYGRDIFSRVLYSARIDLQMGIFGVFLPFVLGTFLGLYAGYFGGAVDAVLMRVVDTMLAFPWLILLMAIISVLGNGVHSFYIAIALVGWVAYARLVRAKVLVLRRQDYVTAARNLGYSNMRIVFKHILPNALASSIVFAMSDVVLVLLAGAGISFIGMGVQPPTPEWGVMIAEGQIFITSAWWISAFPGFAIVFLALGFSLLADGLAEKLEVEQ